jgi:hypothetical protein
MSVRCYDTYWSAPSGEKTRKRIRTLLTANRILPAVDHCDARADWHPHLTSPVVRNTFVRLPTLSATSATATPPANAGTPPRQCCRRCGGYRCGCGVGSCRVSLTATANVSLLLPVWRCCRHHPDALFDTSNTLPTSRKPLIFQCCHYSGFCPHPDSPSSSASLVGTGDVLPASSDTSWPSPSSSSPPESGDICFCAPSFPSDQFCCLNCSNSIRSGVMTSFCFRPFILFNVPPSVCQYG